ncbi:MAG: biotin transporter BioY [Selenomonadaceae bacterium]|nr:biotin transporter BioY [Selenomonadaceae bacterium]MBR3721374.1 biotin transporter BioY [Selenomonadaceae bacterium]
MKFTTREITLAALFVAFITIGAYVKIPFGSYVYTLQFLFTLMAGIVLGAKLGAFSVFVYVLMGLIGIPVFTAGGGPQYVLNPTFGYLIGFIIQAYACGKFSRNIKVPDFKKLFAVNLIGLVIVYVFGISWFYAASNYVLNTPISAWAALFYCGIVQIPPDLLLAAAAAKIGLKLYRAGFWI